jgi:hypothetical protein
MWDIFRCCLLLHEWLTTTLRATRKNTRKIFIRWKFNFGKFNFQWNVFEKFSSSLYFSPCQLKDIFRTKDIIYYEATHSLTHVCHKMLKKSTHLVKLWRKNVFHVHSISSLPSLFSLAFILWLCCSQKKISHSAFIGWNERNFWLLTLKWTRIVLNYINVCEREWDEFIYKWRFFVFVSRKSMKNSTFNFIFPLLSSATSPLLFLHTTQHQFTPRQLPLT